MTPTDIRENIMIVSDSEDCDSKVREVSILMSLPILRPNGIAKEDKTIIHAKSEGLCLEHNENSLMCDLEEMLPRLKRSNLCTELLVRAAKIKGSDRPLTVIDATAGLGEDSLLLAAAGFEVKMYEKNPVIAALLKDAVNRAEGSQELKEAIGRMEIFCQDSIDAMYKLTEHPDIVYLDPMFPEKFKNSLCKKKFQLLHRLETPCADEYELMQSAVAAKPVRIIIKRPLKGAYLCDKKPSFSLKGKAVRYDCIVFPENIR